jgi:hypothetical protein
MEILESENDGDQTSDAPAHVSRQHLQSSATTDYQWLELLPGSSSACLRLTNLKIAQLQVDQEASVVVRPVGRLTRTTPQIR